MFTVAGRGERKKIDVKEKHWSVASRVHPDWGLNPQPFDVWDDAPTNWATRPGLTFILKKKKIYGDIIYIPWKKVVDDR